MSHDTHDDSIYIKILLALGVLTVITVLASSKAGVVDFGAWSLAIAMLIASVKAALVALHFMHLKAEKLEVWLYAVFPLVLLALLMAGVFIDNPFRTHFHEGANMETSAPVADAHADASHDSGHH